MYKLNLKTLQFEKINFIKLGLVSVTLITLTGFVGNKIGYDSSRHEFIQSLSNDEKTFIIRELNKFSEEKLISEIEKLNIKFPRIVLAQAKLESNNFKSKIFKENNNLFGMKVAKSRPTTNSGEQYNHATFDSWRDCLIDYCMYQSRYLGHIKSEDEYFRYLSESYAEDTTYITKLKKIINGKR